VHKKNLALLAGAIHAACLGAAQTSAAQETTVFEPVIVTAQKREQNIYEVPVAISAFTAETMERQGISDLTDIGKFVPNLNVTGFSAGHTSSVNPFIRGIGLQDHLITTDPGVGVYLDGVYLGRQVGQNWSLANIERVEVLRGPQGTLYGRNSIGGAINIITRQPGDEEGGRVSFTGGSRGRMNADFYTNMQLSDRFAMSLTGAYQHRDGLGRFVNIENPRKEVGETDDLSARVAIKWSPTDQLSFLLAVDGNDGEGGLRPYDTLIDEVPTGGVYAAGYRNSDTATNPYNNNTGQESQIAVTNEAQGVSLTVDYDISDTMAAKLIVSDRHSEYKSGLDDDGFFDDFLSFPEKGEADQKSAELQLTGEFGAFDYVAGLYWFEEEGENSQDPTIFLGGPGDFLLTQEMDSQAVYGNVGYHLSDDLRISAGLRYTQDDKTAGTNINSGLVVDTSSRDWSEVSWDLSANYQMNDRMNVYGTIQSGYQSGQFPPRPFCLFGSVDFSQNPPALNPVNCFEANDNVTALNYEVGIKGQPFDSLQMSIAVFYTDYSDLPYQVTIKAAEWFTAQPWIDANRLAAGGGSFGGYLAATILGRPHPFKTLVAHAAVYDSYAQNASDGGASKKRYGEYWEDLERFNRNSPHLAAANFKTPTLVIHGQLDRRVPINNGIELFNTLQNRGVPSKFVYFPDENHWVLKPQNSLFWYDSVRKWIGQYVPPGPAAAAPATTTQTSNK
jgi:iron complex outermembrane receptor protein